jgi:hypothetical protein
MPLLTYLRLDDDELLLEAQLEYPLLPLELNAEILRRGLGNRLETLIDSGLRSPR